MKTKPSDVPSVAECSNPKNATYDSAGKCISGQVFHKIKQGCAYCVVEKLEAENARFQSKLEITGRTLARRSDQLQKHKAKLLLTEAALEVAKEGLEDIASRHNIVYVNIANETLFRIQEILKGER